MARNGSVDPITDVQTATVNNSSDVAVTSQSTNNKVVYGKLATISSTITIKSAILDGSAASLSEKVSFERSNIHNGEFNFDEPEHKAPTRTMNLRPSVSQARRFEGRYSSCSIPSCLQPNVQWRIGLLHRS